eukprot:2437499-Alexandrium_andersonii.AAC.1
MGLDAHHSVPPPARSPGEPRPVGRAVLAAAPPFHGPGPALAPGRPRGAHPRGRGACGPECRGGPGGRAGGSGHGSGAQ